MSSSNPDQDPKAAVCALLERRLAESELPCLQNALATVEKVFGRRLTTSQWDTVLAALKNTFVVSNLDLTKLFHLKKESKEPVSLKHGFVVLYIRSYKFKVAPLRTVIDLYAKERSDDAFCKAWRARLSNLDDNSDVYCRYVGCTSRSAEERFVEDKNKGQPTRRSSFLDCVQAKLGNVTPTIFTVPNLQVPDKEESTERTRKVDEAEQVLIHLFGRDALLNSQPGGFDRYYRPRDDDLALIKKLDLHLESPEMDLDIWSSAKRKIRKLVKEVAPECPAPNIGLVVDDMVTIHIAPTIFAKDITAINYKNNWPFFSGARSGRLTSKLLRVINEHAATPLRLGKPAFMDLFCTPDHDELIPKAKTVAKSLQETRSAVVATFGYLPTAVAMSSFRGLYVMERKKMKNALLTHFFFVFFFSFKRRSLTKAEFKNVLGKT